MFQIEIGSGMIRLTSELGNNQNVLPFILTQERFKRFWLAWDSKCLWAGINDNLKVETSCELKIEINYFTISTRDRINPCTFRFEGEFK